MIEIVASSLRDGLMIQRAGADRIELVSALGEGGVTPSIGLVQALIARTHLPLAVMLRPNRPDFMYSNYEIEVLRRDAVIMDKLGIKHVVMGIISREGLPDIRRIEQVLDGTNLELTFHRAIDATPDPLSSLRYLNEYDRVTHVRTSGGPGTIDHQLDTLARMLDLSRKRIIIGGDVDEAIINTLRARFPKEAFDVHVGAAVRGGDARGAVNESEVRQLVTAYTNGRNK